MKVIRLLFLPVALLLLLQGCGGRPVSVPTQAPGIALKDICSKYNIRWTWDGVTQVVLLEYKDNKAKALVGSNIVLLGKERISLSAPIRRENSTIYVPEDFESKIIAPFGVSIGKLGMPSMGGLRIKSVVLDAGHGGKDPGAAGPSGVREKEVVLEITRHLKSLLEEAGVKVIMTRETDVFVSLAERTEIASKSSADLFVSIHANSNPVRKTQGMEVYYVKTQSKKDLDEEQRQKNEKTFARRLGSESPTVTTIVADMMYQFKVAESAKLARKIVNKAALDLGAPNRGARACRFFVVRNTLIPAVLVEVGFLTNRVEEKKLKSSGYRQRVARAVARSILDYAND